MGGVLAKIVFKSATEDFELPDAPLWQMKQKDIDGQEIELGTLLTNKTKVVLFVNVATK